TPLAPLIRVLCASPAYLERRGVPQSPLELEEHDGLDWDGLAPQFAWRFEINGQRQLCRPRRQRMTTNNAETLLYGAVSGLGIAHLPTWLVSEHRSEEHTSELQSRENLVCRLLLEKK